MVFYVETIFGSALPWRLRLPDATPGTDDAGRYTAKRQFRPLPDSASFLGVAGCAREEEPAPPPAPTPPAAATPAPAQAAAAAAPIADSTDPLAHGRYLVETVAGCGNCHTPRLPDGT